MFIVSNTPGSLVWTHFRSAQGIRRGRRERSQSNIVRRWSYPGTVAPHYNGLLGEDMLLRVWHPRSAIPLHQGSTGQSIQVEKREEKPEDLQLDLRNNTPREADTTWRRFCVIPFVQILTVGCLFEMPVWEKWYYSVRFAGIRHDPWFSILRCEMVHHAPCYLNLQLATKYVLVLSLQSS